MNLERMLTRLKVSRKTMSNLNKGETMERANVAEHLPHDECHKCGQASVPAEGVPDQTLRGCPQCEDTWLEDLNAPPYRKPKTSPTKGEK